MWRFSGWIGYVCLRTGAIYDGMEIYAPFKRNVRDVGVQVFVLVSMLLAFGGTIKRWCVPQADTLPAV